MIDGVLLRRRRAIAGVFDITLRDGKLTRIQEYIDTQALARASEMAASPKP